MLRITIEVTAEGGLQRIGQLDIVQVSQHEGSLRSYSVDGWCIPMRRATRNRVNRAGFVERHDRELPVWSLLLKAISAIYQGGAPRGPVGERV